VAIAIVIFGYHDFVRRAFSKGYLAIMLQASGTINITFATCTPSICRSYIFRGNSQRFVYYNEMS
jgi:hypothetical protein